MTESAALRGHFERVQTGYGSAAEAAQKIMPWPATHYGCRVVELGEASEDWAVSGHVPERRAKAAVMHYLRVDCSYNLRDDEYGFDRQTFADVAEASVDHSWAAPTGDEDEPWEWCDAFREGAEPVTLVSVR